MTRGDPLALATGNAVALWELFGAARGHRVIRHPSFLAVDAGTAQGGLRVVVRRPAVPPDEAEILLNLVRRQAGPTTIEDPFGALPLNGEGRLSYPVMIRYPAAAPTASGPDPAAPLARPTALSGDTAEPSDTAVRGGGPAVRRPVEVVRVRDAGTLADLEQMIAEEFPVHSFLPYRRGAMFPPALLSADGMEFFAATAGGRPVAGCLTVVSGDGAGLYWVATSRTHRRQGVGRALLTAVLGLLGGFPVTLAATAEGEPLYHAFGFRPVARATWWRLDGDDPTG